MTLFTDDEIPTVPKLGKEALRARLLSAYATELLEHPPVRSLSADWEPDSRKRETEAKRLAGKDVARLLAAIKRGGLEIGDANRIATLKSLLSDFINVYREGQNNGGNPVETDIEALVERAVKAIQP